MAKAWFTLTTLSLLICSVAIAQDPPPRISDEGGSKSVYFNLDCTGAGVTCSTSGINATIDVPGGGSATFTVEEDNASVDAAVTNLDFLSCFDITSSPAGEANVAFDSGECTVNADALKANGANCAANSFPLGVDASGAAESCSTSISGNAATATALAANGANCSAGSGAGGVDASGASEDCTDYYSTLAELQTAVTNDFHNLGGTDDDVPESGDFGNLTAGDNLTFSPAGTLNVDNPVVANLTGNASTATALAANGANCAASSFPLGVDASGAAESCSTDISGNAATVTFADAGGDTTMGVALATDATGNLSPRTDAGITYNATTNALTTTTFIGALTGNASTATALAANGANCSAGNYPLGVDASGAVETCTADDDVPESGDLAAATLEVVTTAGKTTSQGVTFLDSVNATWGTDSDVTCKYVNATQDFECDNALSDNDVLWDIDGLPINLTTTQNSSLSVDPAFEIDASVTNLASPWSKAGILDLASSIDCGGGGCANSYKGMVLRNSWNEAGAGNSLYGLEFDNEINTASTFSGYLYGLSGGISLRANSVHPGIISIYSASASYNVTPAITDYWDFYAGSFGELGAANPTITNRYGFYVADANGTPTITNNYGVYISAITDGTNDYPLFLAGTAKQFFTDANVTINASSSGNLNLHASSDIDSDQTISFPDNEGTRFGTGDDASMYYNGTDLILDPDLVGTGVVRIGATSDSNLIGNRLNFCNTAIDTTAYVKGDCTGTARAALNFKLTKTGSNGTMGNTITMVNQTTAVSPNVTGLATTVTSDNTSETGGVYTGHKVIFGSLQDPSGAADMDFIGYQLVPTTFAAYTSDTVNQIGLHMDNLTLPSGASAGALYSGVFEEDLAFVAGRCIEFENSGDGAFTAGDSKFCHDSTDNTFELTQDALKIAEFDDADFTQFGDIAAGNYLQIYNAASGVIPEGSWKAVGTALYAVDGDKPAFCYSGDVDACLQFSTTNSYEFRDLSGTSRFNLDVVNGDIEVGTTARGIDMVTSGNQLTIGRTNAGSIVSGALATTVSQSYQTTDPDVTAYQWTVQTTGTDPTIIREAARITTTDATVTTILTIPIAATSATLIECRVGGIRTGGVAGTAGDGASYVLRCGYRDSAGTTTERTDTIDFTSEDQAGWNTNCAVSGTNALVQVNGAASNNVTWQAWCEYFTVVN